MAYNYEYPYVDPEQYNSDWLVNKVKELEEEWDIKFPQWENDLEEQDKLITQIRQDLDNIVKLSPGFMENLISNAIKNVYFGITEDGYFCVWIPESWKDITFATTGYDTTILTQLEYGHLAIYDAQKGA